MASFLQGFTKGFMDTKSQGMEDETKNNLAIERDRDRILTENILRTATEFHKNYPKAVADTKKTFDRYQTALQLTGGNQAAAEAIAKDHDLRLNDFDRIVPIMDAFKGQKDYKSTIPQETKEQYEALHGQGSKASAEANRLLAGSKQLKSKLQPFEMPALNPGTYTVQNRPTIEIPRANPALKAQEFILTHPNRFASTEAAVGFVNSRREEAGLPPLGMQEGSKLFQGIQFGAVEDNKRLTQAKQLAASEGLNGPALERRALEISLGQAPRGIAIGGSDHRALQKAVTEDVNRIAGAQWIRDPNSPDPNAFTFKFADPAIQERAFAASVTAQKMLEFDLMSSERPKPTSQYAYSAAVHHKLTKENADVPVLKPIPNTGTGVPTPMNQSTAPNPQGTPKSQGPTQAGTILKPNAADGSAPAVTPPAIPDPQAKPTGAANKPPVWKEGEVRPALEGNTWGLPTNTQMKVEGGKIWAMINGKWSAPPKPQPHK